MLRTKKKSAQDLQDDIFRKMSADRKLEVAAGLWRLAKDLDSDKIDFRPRSISINRGLGGRKTWKK